MTAFGTLVNTKCMFLGSILHFFEICRVSCNIAMTLIPHSSYLPAGSVANFYLTIPSFRAWVVPMHSTDRETEAQRAYIPGPKLPASSWQTYT